MPSLQTLARRHYAVLWPVVGIDDNGNPRVSAPREIKVRWEDDDHQTRAQKGTADVALLVGERLVEGSLLWRGRLADVPSPEIAENFSNVVVYQVIDIKEVPALKGPNKSITAFAMRHSTKIPQVL